MTPLPKWIGWLEIGLHPWPSSPSPPPGIGGAVATLDVSVRADIVSLWIGSRTVAVVDRDRLREWVHSPSKPLPVDDVEFVLIERQLCLRVDGAGPFPLPAGAVSHLVSAL